MLYLMVLNDEETYSNLKGCKIIAVDNAGLLSSDLDEVVKAVCQGNVAPGEIITIFE